MRIHRQWYRQVKNQPIIIGSLLVIIVVLPIAVLFLQKQQTINQNAATVTPTPVQCTTNPSAPPSVDQSVLFYQAQPQPYTWTLQPPYDPSVPTKYQGQTLTNNLNPFGFEVYACQSANSPSAINHNAKLAHDMCVP